MSAERMHSGDPGFDERLSNVAWGTDDAYTPEERAVARWQMGRFLQVSRFEEALWKLFETADDHNLARLEEGFPMEVGAYKRWTGRTGTGERGWADRVRDKTGLSL